MYYLFGNIIMEYQRNASDGNVIRVQRDKLATDLQAAAVQRGLTPTAHWDYPAGVQPYEFAERYIEGSKTSRNRYALMFCYAHESHSVIEQAHADLSSFLAGSRWADGVAGTASD